MKSYYVIRNLGTYNLPPLQWCIYILDKEFSFETGLPFALQDSDMDTNLPEPVHQASLPAFLPIVLYDRADMW